MDGKKKVKTKIFKFVFVLHKREPVVMEVVTTSPKSAWLKVVVDFSKLSLPAVVVSITLMSMEDIGGNTGLKGKPIAPKKIVHVHRQPTISM